MTNWPTKKLGDKEYFEILGSGIEKFEGEKEYLSTSSIEGNKIVAIEDVITYQKRPSRANMQPRLSSVWFARMKNTIKVYSFTGVNKEKKDKKDKKDKYILSTGFAGILCNPEKVNPKYLEKIFLSEWFNNLKDGFASDKAIQKSLNNEDIVNLEIPLPPISAQQKIVYVLDCVQVVVGAQEKIIEKTKELKKVMMAKLFREGTRGEKLKKTETPKQSKLATGQVGEIPESWEIVEFEKALDSELSYEVGELKQKDFQSTGQFPIIDQSEALIAGYSDDGEKVYKGKLPIIIFGDHTRVVKYVDFPFIIGGSGVKILIPNKEFNILFLFYAINNLNLPSRGYNRHFKLLREKLIPKPELSEQQEIAEILQTIDQKIEIEQRKKALYEELFKTMLNKIMSREIKVDNLNLKYAAKNRKKIS